MIFKISVNVKGLPSTPDAISYSGQVRNYLSQGQDILFCDAQNDKAFFLRDGQKFPLCKGGSDAWTFILEFDDFDPGVEPHDYPAWYASLKDRIILVQAEQGYGASHGIEVTEKVTLESAKARVRHQQLPNGPLVYLVKIVANGPNALQDARELHLQILSRRPD